MIGQTLAHYKVLEKLGEGGMGVVYKAEDTKLKRIVALKFLPTHLAASDADKSRFMLEAQAAASLNHPNICTIYGIDEYEGPQGDKQMFFAMEFVDGHTLREKMASVSFKQAIDIAIQIADGLAAAHEKGIVHRDIKPENIMVRKDGICQVMDFGLAKLRASGSKITRLTKEGSTVGTAGYMSPEQVQGQDTDHRSDIFSYGVLVYELLTGQLPFRGVHATALAYEIVNVDAAPMSVVNPEIDPSLDAIVLECLEKDVNERAQSIKQIGVDLKKYKRESSRQRMSRVTAARPAIKVPRSSEAAEPARSSRSINPGYVLSGLLALAVVLLVWSPWKKTDRSPGPIVRSSISLPRTAPVSGLGIAVSPDGKYLVYTAQSGQLQLYRLDLASSQPIPGAFGSVPAFSPDGQWVVFYSLQGKIEKVPLTGSAPEEIYASQSFTPGFWWTPDNTILFGNYSSGLGRIPLAGGTPEAVTTLDSAAGEISHRFPQLLPDGKTVIYTAKTKDMASFDEALVVAQRLDGTKRKVLVKGGYYGRYLPSGHLVYLRGTTAFAVQFDPEQMELIGSPVQVEQGGALDNGGTVCLGISTSGVAVFAPASSAFDINSTSLVWLDQAGSVRPLYDTLRNYAAALLSPDGQKVAVGIASANDDIWIYDIPRGLLTRLTYGWGNNNSPVWSADGSSVIYSAEKGQTANLYRKPWDGSGGEERLTVSANPQTPIDVTPDGKFLSFDENGDIWILPLDSAGASGRGAPYPFLQTPALETGGVFSRDGKWLVYTSDESGKPEVYVVSFPKRAGKQQLSNGGGFAGGFSRDGKQFFYGAGGNLMVIDVNAGSRFDYSVPRKFCTLPPKVDPKDIALDGKRILALLDHAKRDSVLRLDVVTEWFEVVKAKTSPSSN